MKDKAKDAVVENEMDSRENRAHKQEGQSLHIVRVRLDRVGGVQHGRQKGLVEFSQNSACLGGRRPRGSLQAGSTAWLAYEELNLERGGLDCG